MTPSEKSRHCRVPSWSFEVLLVGLERGEGGREVMFIGREKWRSDYEHGEKEGVGGSSSWFH